jgi:hypothetical protein
MRTVLLALALMGCSDNTHVEPDAPTPIDAAPDAPPALDCPTYCAEIQANCTGANAQYSDQSACEATCKSFATETSTVNDMTGNTLGCRIYYAGNPAVTDPGTHCVQAGPGGDVIAATSPAACSGGDVCTSFCKLEIQACGSLDQPLPGEPTDNTNNPIYQYRHMGDCINACTGYDKQHQYSTTATGDSLACRLYEATLAAVAVMPNGVTHCRNTGDFARGPCVGAPTP